MAMNIVLIDMFSVKQKKLFLIFVWSRSTLPNRDEDFSSKFLIDAFHVRDVEVDRALPRKIKHYTALVHSFFVSLFSRRTYLRFFNRSSCVFKCVCDV